jgi:hypothetical protein
VELAVVFMETRSRPKQRSITEFFNHDDEDSHENNSDEGQSQSSDAFDSFDQAEYITTNMLYRRNLTVADVEIDVVSRNDMIHLYEELVDSLSDFEDEGYIIDPKQVYLCRRNDPHLQSLLDEQ